MALTCNFSPHISTHKSNIVIKPFGKVLRLKQKHISVKKTVLPSLKIRSSFKNKVNKRLLCILVYFSLSWYCFLFHNVYVSNISNDYRYNLVALIFKLELEKNKCLNQLFEQVFEDQSNGIVCYTDESGEIVCEGIDEGPRYHQPVPRKYSVPR